MSVQNMVFFTFTLQQCFDLVKFQPVTRPYYACANQKDSWACASSLHENDPSMLATLTKHYSFSSVQIYYRCVNIREFYRKRKRDDSSASGRDILLKRGAYFVYPIGLYVCATCNARIEYDLKFFLEENLYKLFTFYTFYKPNFKTIFMFKET